MNKRKEIYFGSFISYNGSERNNALSDRVLVDQDSKTGCKTTKNKNVDAFGWMTEQNHTTFSSNHKTMSFQGKARYIENSIKKKLNKSHNRLTKNLGCVYNKMVLDEIQKQKR